MAAAKYTMPNWAQALIVQKINLPTETTVVCNENDENISFMDLKTRREYIVKKSTGQVVEAAIATMDIRKGGAPTVQS